MDFDDQGPKPSAVRRVGGDPEQSPGVGSSPQHQRAWIAAQLDKTGSMDQATAPLRFIGAKPENWCPAGSGTKPQHSDETHRVRPIVGINSVEFMYTPASKTAAKLGIESLMASCDPFVRRPQSAACK